MIRHFSSRPGLWRSTGVICSVFLVITLIWSVKPASAQRQITCRVVDIETAKPISGAEVILEGTERRAQTNALGYFQLQIDSMTKLVLNAEGYLSGQVNVPDAVTNFRIDMQPRQEIIEVVEETARFPGGMAAFCEFVGNNLRIPRGAHGIEGEVYVEFVIDATGAVPPDSVVVLKGFNKSCDHEAVRVIRLSPRWTPGTQRGNPVAQRMVLPVKFRVSR